MEGEARSHDQSKLEAQLNAMRNTFEEAARSAGATVEFTSEESYRTYKIGEDARPYQDAARAIRSLGIEVVPRKSGGGTDGNLFNAKGIPCVALPTGMVDEHATTEHIAIEDMLLCVSDPGHHRHPGSRMKESEGGGSRFRPYSGWP